MPEQTLGGIPLGLGMVMKINFLNFHVCMCVCVEKLICTCVCVRVCVTNMFGVISVTLESLTNQVSSV